MEGSGESQRPEEGSEKSTPLMKRMRHAGRRGSSGFRQRHAIPWFIAGGGIIALLALGPFLLPESNPWVERVATVLALFSFLAAVGFWFRMGNRSFAIAAAVVVLLYAATAWTSILEVRDIFVLTLIAGFLVFTLAGFNILFILEEVVYDAHRMLRFRHPAWSVLPSILVIAVLAALPLVEDLVPGARFGGLRALTPVLAAVLLIAWGVRIMVKKGGMTLMREVHLLVVGALAGAGLADAVSLLRGSTGLLPSVIGYLAILGTWMYMAFTTLHRAQYFLRARDVEPWILLMLSASFAVLAHTHAQYGLGGEAALADVADLRISYLVLGVWIGLVFFVLRGIWRLLSFIRDERGLGRRTRILAGRLARLTEGLLLTEGRVGELAFRIYSVVERILPGRHKAPERPFYINLEGPESLPVVPVAVPLQSDDSEE